MPLTNSSPPTTCHPLSAHHPLPSTSHLPPCAHQLLVVTCHLPLGTCHRQQSPVPYHIPPITRHCHLQSSPTTRRQPTTTKRAPPTAQALGPWPHPTSRPSAPLPLPLSFIIYQIISHLYATNYQRAYYLPSGPSYPQFHPPRCHHHIYVCAK